MRSVTFTLANKASLEPFQALPMMIDDPITAEKNNVSRILNATLEEKLMLAEKMNLTRTFNPLLPPTG